MQRLDRYREVATAAARPRTRPTTATARKEELEADKAAQEAAHQPPHYVGRCAHLTRGRARGAGEAEGRQPVIRFRVGEGVVAFDDIVRGHVEIDTTALGGDLIIVRSDGTPLYHFTVCVDDVDMEISHIIRGEDHLSNTPKHILLFRAMGAALPQFAHLPLILNPDRTKMSKRKSQTAVADYRAQGYIPEAFVNFLGLLGWASGTEEEIFSLDELVERFELERVHSGRRRVRQGAARVAQRPVDPQAVRRGAGRARAALPAGGPARRPSEAGARRDAFPARRSCGR